MPIPFNYEIKKIVRKTDISKNLKDNNSEWVAWRYCGIFKNFKAHSVPLITVAFRELTNKALSDIEILRTIPINILGQVRLGTIWKNGKCNSMAVFESFNSVVVDFTEEQWRLNSFYDSSNNNKTTPYPHSLYPLYPRDKSWFLEFPIPKHGKLVIPCMEFFASCYGYSEETNRILTTYSWENGEDSVVNRLTAPIDVPEDGRWVVNLQPSISSDDAVLVAHLKYDKHSQSNAKEIYAQLSAGFKADAKNAVFIKIKPWFQGLAELNLEGIWFDNKKSFLALRVNGISDPDGVPIERYRRYDHKVEVAVDGVGTDKLPIYRPRGNIKRPDIVSVTSDNEPDTNSSTAIIFNDERQKLGNPRVVIPAKLIKTGNRTVIVTTGNSNPSEFSTGEEHGRGKGVGRLLIYTKPVVESRGVLRDMWNAMLFLKDKYPTQITSIDWFTFEDGFNNDVEPRLIAFQQFEEASLKKISKTIFEWPYLEQNQMRGLLVTRIVAGSKTVYIYEIQRRKESKKGKGGVIISDKDKFQGYVFTLINNNDFEVSLREFMNQVRYVVGVVNNLTHNIDGQVDIFKHVPSKDDQVSCESTVIKALGKMGIKI